MSPPVETGETTGEGPAPSAAETLPSGPAETPVPQAAQPVTGKRETLIVTARGEDVSKWRRYAATYHRRSLTSANAETRQRNREEYLHWKQLLETAGYQVQEIADENRLEITEPNTTHQ